MCNKNNELKNSAYKYKYIKNNSNLLTSGMLWLINRLQCGYIKPSLLLHTGELLCPWFVYIET